MEEHPSPYEQGQIPEEARREAVKKAPMTLTGLGVGGVLGAVAAGPIGALVGGVFGGVVGCVYDVKQKHQ